MRKKSSKWNKRFVSLIALMGGALVTNPGALFAQRGGGGGHVGGPAAGGGGLSQVGRASGPDQKDELRDFHQIMAVQASGEQKLAFAAMVKSTAVAIAELEGFEGQLKKRDGGAEISQAGKNLGDAMETARTLNKKFLEGFSEAQRSGLKEMIKRLGKAEAELGQQGRGLDQAFEGKVSGLQMEGAAEGLGRSLEGFQREQRGLGEEMSIDLSDGGQEAAYNLPPAKNAVTIGNQTITIATSGMVSRGTVEGGEDLFTAEMVADLTDLQHGLRELLGGRINEANRCGENIEMTTAELAPNDPGSSVLAQLHYERWSCHTVLGREDVSEIVEGNAGVEVKLTPVVAEDGRLGFQSQLGRVDAEGLLGEAMGGGGRGDRLREKISAAVLAGLSEGAEFKGALPADAQGWARLKRARFQGTGAGRMVVVLEGEIRVPQEKLGAVTEELKQASATAAERAVVQPELTAR
jgi:hypothetical protein